MYLLQKREKKKIYIFQMVQGRLCCVISEMQFSLQGICRVKEFVSQASSSYKIKHSSVNWNILEGIS